VRSFENAVREQLFELWFGLLFIIPNDNYNYYIGIVLGVIERFHGLLHKNYCIRRDHFQKCMGHLALKSIDTTVLHLLESVCIRVVC
jgi:hypothetical protein